jgi:signal transduction histidine kinase
VNAKSIPSTSLHRLDKTLFWLRWLFVIGVALFMLLIEDTLPGTLPDQPHLALALGTAAVGNLVAGGLTLSARLSERLLGAFSVVLDSALAVLLCWTYGGSAAPLVVLGTLAVLVAAYRFQWSGIALVMILLSAGSAITLLALGEQDHDMMVLLASGLGFLLAFGTLGVALHTRGWLFQTAQQLLTERETEAQRLRAARERAYAIYDVANTLGATLDYRDVLDAIQNVGMMGLHEMGPDARLISAVLLFQGEDNMLRVATSRRLTRNDEQVAIPGRRGVLGLALRQAQPVFAGDASRDPELRYFVAFQDAASVLAIPLRAGFDNYGVLVFGSDKPDAFSDEHVELLTAIGTQATIALQKAVLYQNLLSEKERIVEVEEDARKKLSRDLHDGPTQSVAAIAMRVNYIRRLIELQPQQATEELWKVEELARRTTKEIRHMLFTLRPLVLENQGLIAALNQLGEKMRDTHNTNVLLQAQPDAEEYLDTHAQGVLFYIIEEAVNNARKHAEADHIWTRLYRRKSFLVVEIEDDGVGFDVGAVDASYDQRSSLGMVNMRERAELIEGTLRIQSAAGRGTKITVLVPIRPLGKPGASDDSSPEPPIELKSQRLG